MIPCLVKSTRRLTVEFIPWLSSILCILLLCHTCVTLSCEPTRIHTLWCWELLSIRSDWYSSLVLSIIAVREGSVYDVAMSRWPYCCIIIPDMQLLGWVFIDGFKKIENNDVPHCTALYCTASHCTALHCTVLYCIALFYITPYCRTVHCSTLHYLFFHPSSCRSNTHEAVRVVYPHTPGPITRNYPVSWGNLCVLKFQPLRPYILCTLYIQWRYDVFKVKYVNVLFLKKSNKCCDGFIRAKDRHSEGLV